MIHSLCKTKLFLFKTKRDKKRRCLSQTYGKIVSISSMKIQRHRAYFPTYEYVVGDEVIRIEINFGTTYLLNMVVEDMMDKCISAIYLLRLPFPEMGFAP